MHSSVLKKQARILHVLKYIYALKGSTILCLDFYEWKRKGVSSIAPLVLYVTARNEQPFTKSFFPAPSSHVA